MSMMVLAGRVAYPLGARDNSGSGPAAFISYIYAIARRTAGYLNI